MIPLGSSWRAAWGGGLWTHTSLSGNPCHVTHYVISGKLLNLPGPHFPHLQTEGSAHSWVAGKVNGEVLPGHSSRCPGDTAAAANSATWWREVERAAGLRPVHDSWSPGLLSTQGLRTMQLNESTGTASLLHQAGSAPSL